MLLHNFFHPIVSFVTVYVLVDLSFTLYMYHRGWGMKIYCKKCGAHETSFIIHHNTHLANLFETRLGKDLRLLNSAATMFHCNFSFPFQKCVHFELLGQVTKKE